MKRLRAVTSCLLLLSIKEAVAVGPPLSQETQPEVTTRQAFSARNLDLKRNQDDAKLLLKREKFADRRIKHPFLITRDDLDAVVEDNVIVESNVLRLVRPGDRKTSGKLYDDRSLVPHKRVTRGWNLQYVIVPQQYYYYRVKKNGR